MRKGKTAKTRPAVSTPVTMAMIERTKTHFYCSDYRCLRIMKAEAEKRGIFWLRGSLDPDIILHDEAASSATSIFTLNFCMSIGSHINDYE